MNMRITDGVVWITAGVACIAGTIAATITDFKRTKKYNKVSDEIIETERTRKKFWKKATDEAIDPKECPDETVDLKDIKKSPTTV